MLNTTTFTYSFQFVRNLFQLISQVYLPFVFLGPKLVKKGMNLTWVVNISNFIFMTFSFAGAIISGYYMFLLYDEGENKSYHERILNTICDDRFFKTYHGN
jgi:hypothetical protein